MLNHQIEAEEDTKGARRPLSTTRRDKTNRTATFSCTILESPASRFHATVQWRPARSDILPRLKRHPRQDSREEARSGLKRGGGGGGRMVRVFTFVGLVAVTYVGVKALDNVVVWMAERRQANAEEMKLERDAAQLKQQLLREIREKQSM